eukprot:8464495-Lingulodinium_polyedra.AAC.1
MALVAACPQPDAFVDIDAHLAAVNAFILGACRDAFPHGKRPRRHGISEQVWQIMAGRRAWRAQRLAA